MKQDQKYHFRRLFLNECGQAAVEYILLIVVVVSLVMGAKKAFGHVDDLISHYIGDYVTCLMEYGELPSLGVAAADQKKHLDGTGKKCDEDFAGFTFEDGRPSNGGGGPGSGGTGTGGTGKTGSGNNDNSANNGNKNNSSNAAKDGSNNKSGKDGGSDSGSDLGAGGGRNGSKSGKQQTPYAKGEVSRSNSLTTNDASDDGSRKVRVLEEDEEAKKKRKNSGAGFRSRGGSYGGNDRYRAITGFMQAEMEKTIPRKPRAPSSTIVRLKDDGFRLGPYSKSFTPHVVKPPTVKDDDNSGFSFGFFIRWLLIAAMILAIIVFFGGQIMNYSNSKD